MCECAQAHIHQLFTTIEQNKYYFSIETKKNVSNVISLRDKYSFNEFVLNVNMQRRHTSTRTVHFCFIYYFHFFSSFFLFVRRNIFIAAH